MADLVPFDQHTQIKPNPGSLLRRGPQAMPGVMISKANQPGRSFADDGVDVPAYVVDTGELSSSRPGSRCSHVNGTVKLQT